METKMSHNFIELRIMIPDDSLKLNMIKIIAFFKLNLSLILSYMNMYIKFLAGGLSSPPSPKTSNMYQLAKTDLT